MIAVINRLPAKEGMADQVIERFANDQEFVRVISISISVEVLRAEETDEVVRTNG